MLDGLGERRTDTIPVTFERTDIDETDDSCYSAKKTGAGEGIRTLDPNLGKVVLYP